MQRLFAAEGMPEIVAELGQEKTARLYNTIVNELKKNGLYSGKRVWLLTALVKSFVDDVLPEYIILLLANRHPKDKIITDLEGLLSPEVSAAFTHWLFEEIERMKGNGTIILSRS